VETVLVVHGLWLHGFIMSVMARRIARHGYRVRTYSYPTMRLTLTQNAHRLARYAGSLGCKVHLVGHSMGGLVALEAARRMPPHVRGRVVMIAPPYGECFSAQCLTRWPGGRAILGRSMVEWISAEHSASLQDCEIGVIAGTGGIGLGRLVARGLPKPHDGVVALPETRVPGMRDHLALPVSHTAMIVSSAVVHQTCAFLERGEFDRARVEGGGVRLPPRQRRPSERRKTEGFPP
jgi:pimeloyl-ACP methyl ester carboxylesterase